MSKFYKNINLDIKLLSVLVHKPDKKDFGGAINAAKNLSKSLVPYLSIDLAEMGLENRVESWFGGGKHFYSRSYSGIPRLLRKHIRFFRSRIFNAFVFSEIPNVIEHGEYDIVHIHNLHPIWAVYQIARVCKKESIPYVMSCHGIHESFHRKTLHNLSGLKTIAVYIGSKLPLNFIFRNSSYVFASSPADFQILKELRVDEENISIVPNGFPSQINTGLSDLERARIRKEYHVDDNIPVVFHLGELKPHKGVDRLVEALKDIDNEYLCIIAGRITSEAYYEKIQKLIKLYDLNPKIQLKGSITFKEVYDYHQIADIFVIPSSYDTFPLVVLESMASRTAIIGSEVGGIPYQIGDKAGIICSVDIKEFKNAIQFLLENPSKREEMAREAEQRALLKFSWPTIAKLAISGYLKVFEYNDYQVN